MTPEADWRWKLGQAIERIRTACAHIGRATGAPVLAILYPPESEQAVYKEWHTLLASLGGGFEVRTIDALAVTMSAVREFGAAVKRLRVAGTRITSLEEWDKLDAAVRAELAAGREIELD